MSISELAYHKWMQAGKPKGRDWEFWFTAEREIYNKIKLHYFFVYP